MAGHLLTAGYKLHAFTRTRSRAENIVSKGAVLEDTAADVAKKCNVIFTYVLMSSPPSPTVWLDTPRMSRMFTLVPME